MTNSNHMVVINSINIKDNIQKITPSQDNSSQSESFSVGNLQVALPLVKEK